MKFIYLGMQIDHEKFKQMFYNQTKDSCGKNGELACYGMYFLMNLEMSQIFRDPKILISYIYSRPQYYQTTIRIVNPDLAVHNGLGLYKCNFP